MCCQANSLYSRIPSVLRLGNKILIIAMLLVMPLQGIAASLSHLLCALPSAAELMDMPSGHHHDDSIAVQKHNHEGSGTNDDDNNNHATHLSCHQVSFGIPSITVLAFASALPVYHPSSLTSPSLFFPEQPQRPPRA